MLPETKIDYTAPERHGVVTVRYATSAEAHRVATQAVRDYFAEDDSVRRFGVEEVPTSEEDGVFDFPFFVYR